MTIKVKKISIVRVIIGIVILGAVVFYFLNYRLKNQGVFCPDYDGDQEKCLEHKECEWDKEENNCDLIGSVKNKDEGDIENDKDNEDGREKLNRELENIIIQNNPSNELCKKLPLSNQPPYGERYYCLAVVNHDERFCEGIDEENDKNICLAHAKADSSYCKKIQENSAKHVCYYMLAVTSGNANFCSDIDYNQHEREQCYFNFMSNLYQWGRYSEIKTEYCNGLDIPDKYTCLALKERDASICGNNPNCLTFFEQDISFCDKRPDYVSCIKDRAKTSKNVSLCELLSQPDRDSCVGVYCTHTELDVHICNTIEDIEKRQDRYIELAINLSNLGK